MNTTTIQHRDGMTVPAFAIRGVGSRFATRVRVRSGAFAGQRGLVARIDHAESLRVRFESGLELPFGPSELEAI